MPRFLALLAVLLSLPFASVRAAIVPGPEIAPARAVMAPPAFDQWTPRIASQGNGFLAVWTEGAAHPMAVHAARIAADGTVVDAQPLVVAAEGLQADVIWDGRRYVVVWTEDAGVFARFVGTDGAMTEPVRLSALTAESFTYAFPSVAFNGRAFFVAWTEFAGPARFAGAILGADGRVTHLHLGDAETWSPLAAAAAVGETFYLATIDIDYSFGAPRGPQIDLGLTPVSEDGSVGTRAVIAGGMRAPDAQSVVELRAASRGGDALVAWTNVTTTWTVRITGSGAGAVESFGGDLNAVVPDRSGYLLVYDDAGGRWARRADGGTAAAIEMLPGQSRVAAGADSLLLTANAARFWVGSPGWDLYLQHLDGRPVTPLVTAARHQSAPHIAAAGALRLAAWVEVRERRTAIVAARIGPQGAPLDPDGIEIATGNGIVRVAAGPGQWLIVWRSGERVLGSRVAFDGTLLDAQPFEIAPAVFFDDTIAAAWDGEHYVVVFLRGVQTRVGARVTVMAARVRADGAVESPFLELSDVGQNGALAIAAGREGSLVVWMERGGGTLEGALLSRGAAVTRVTFPRPSRYADRDVDVAWNGETFLVAAPLFGEFIRWFFVSPAGTVTPAPASAYLAAASPQFRIVLEVEPLGDAFLLVYERGYTLYAATINRAGYVAHGPAAVGTTTIYDRRVGAAGATIVYARNDDPLRARTSRVSVRELAVTPSPPKRRALR